AGALGERLAAQTCPDRGQDAGREPGDAAEAEPGRGRAGRPRKPRRPPTGGVRVPDRESRPLEPRTRPLGLRIRPVRRELHGRGDDGGRGSHRRRVPGGRRDGRGLPAAPAVLQTRHQDGDAPVPEAVSGERSGRVLPARAGGGHGRRGRRLRARRGGPRRDDGEGDEPPAVLRAREPGGCRASAAYPRFGTRVARLFRGTPRQEGWCLL
ncbi:MAG: hypothetical protein AVDCRST_MAG05-419, partial [uncultured Rubrobacteraceae bacterium]